ncbi:peptidoglycan editing factor PgeF [Desulfovirgula thermocuniculi]|uniref:peptidoglycan editing factor PgeF n=1 Tax=Desulfovirgula thermocuniculi TaxID=348842 RepID=UPI000480DEA0|nr:peptidoglycan editing factor PgeF [Desulfovirgula thermocuniculi]
MPAFRWQEEGEVKYLVFEHFGRTGLVAHGFTSRHGGVSAGEYATLNLAFHVGDDPQRVLANREIACRALGINPAHLVAGEQVHGANVAVVGKGERGRGATSPEGALPATDALVTAEPLVPLSAYFADCVPVFLLDPLRGVAGLAHAGWRGTCLGVAARTVKAMCRRFGSRPADLLAAIGPAIGPCCYQVGEDVAGRVRESLSSWPELLVPGGPGKWHLDLREANRRLLLEAGLDPANIAVAELCTCCRQDLFFSHRGSRGRTGRMAAFIMLR